MKNKSKELDVDLIGGQGPLTKDEEKIISDFIRSQKLLNAKKTISQTEIYSSKKSYCIIKKTTGV